MAWTVSYTETARQQLKKLDRQTARRIVAYLDERIAPLEDARSAGKPLTGPLGSFWRYRIGDYRILCDLQDDSLVILVVAVGNRREVYR